MIDHFRFKIQIRTLAGNFFAPNQKIKSLISESCIASLAFSSMQNIKHTITNLVNVPQSSSKILSSRIKTLQSTLLIKQACDADKIGEELQNKQKEYEEKMLACKDKEEMLRKRQQQVSTRLYMHCVSGNMSL